MTTRIGTSLPREDDATDADRQAMQQLIERLRTDLEAVRAGGSAAAVKRHLSRGKWLARDRVRALLDEATPFLEIGSLCAHEVYDSPLP